MSELYRGCHVWTAGVIRSPAGVPHMIPMCGIVKAWDKHFVRLQMLTKAKQTWLKPRQRVFFTKLRAEQFINTYYGSVREIMADNPLLQNSPSVSLNYRTSERDRPAGAPIGEPNG